MASLATKNPDAVRLFAWHSLERRKAISANSPQCPNEEQVTWPASFTEEGRVYTCYPRLLASGRHGTQTSAPAKWTLLVELPLFNDPEYRAPNMEISKKIAGEFGIKPIRPDNIPVAFLSELQKCEPIFEPELAQLSVPKIAA